MLEDNQTWVLEIYWSQASLVDFATRVRYARGEIFQCGVQDQIVHMVIILPFMAAFIERVRFASIGHQNLKHARGPAHVPNSKTDK